MCQGGDYSSVTSGDTFSHKRRQNATRLCAGVSLPRWGNGVESCGETLPMRRWWDITKSNGLRYKALMCQGGDYSSVTCGDTFSHKRRQNATRLCAGVSLPRWENGVESCGETLRMRRWWDITKSNGLRYKALMCQGGDYSSVTCGDTFSHKRRQNATRLCAGDARVLIC